MPSQGKTPTHSRQLGYIHTPYGIWLPWQPYCSKAVFVKAVAPFRPNWLRYIGYHGNLGVLVVAVDSI